jgi:hypothetical protein
MKVRFSILLFFALTTTVFAQKNHLSLSMGLAQPLGDFALANNLYSDGYAQPGFNLAFEGNYIPRWYVGVGGAVSFATNFSQNSQLFNALVEDINAYSTPNIPDSTLIYYEHEKWSYVSFLVGPTLALPGERIQLNLKAYAGFCVVLPPTQHMEIVFDDSKYYRSGDAQNVAFCYALGTDLIYKLKGNYSLKLGAEYFSTKSESSNKLSYSEDNDITQLVVPNKTVEIRALHLTLGLAYLF